VEAYFWHIAHVINEKTKLSCRRQYDIPPFSYLKSNRQAALVLFPTDWAINNAEPLAPHMVAVGAITAAPAKALPSEVEEFMQSAGDHGVVYASLGTTAIPGALSSSPRCITCMCGRVGLALFNKILSDALDLGVAEGGGVEGEEGLKGLKQWVNLMGGR
jgi:hypothetical protein